MCSETEDDDDDDERYCSVSNRRLTPMLASSIEGGPGGLGAAGPELRSL